MSDDKQHNIHILIDGKEVLMPVSEEARQFYEESRAPEITIREAFLNNATLPEANPRDTQFAGLATLLQEELAALNDRTWNSLDEYIEAKKRIIARRIYDISKHIAMNIAPIDLERLSMDEIVQRIPDMAEWPRSNNERQ